MTGAHQLVAKIVSQIIHFQCLRIIWLLMIIVKGLLFFLGMSLLWQAGQWRAGRPMRILLSWEKVLSLDRQLLLTNVQSVEEDLLPALLLSLWILSSVALLQRHPLALDGWGCTGNGNSRSLKRRDLVPGDGNLRGHNHGNSLPRGHQNSRCNWHSW